MARRAVRGSTAAGGGGPGWGHFPHGADVGVWGEGVSPAEAFGAAALALTAVVTDPGRVAATTPVAIACDGADLELLLVAWLDALIFEMATRRMLFAGFSVTIAAAAAGFHLSSTAWGEPVGVARHRPAVEVKGATFTELAVAERAPGAWLARCVVDV